MSDYFCVTGVNYQEAYDRALQIYGSDVKITGHRTYSRGGFLGLFGREMIELSGFVLPKRVGQKKEFEDQKAAILSTAQAAVGSAPELQITKAIHSALNENFDKLRQSLAEGPQTLPNQRKLEDLLRTNEFAPDYIRSLVDDLKRTLSVSDWSHLRTVEHAALAWIAKTIEVSPDKEEGRAAVHVLVGPTGVGKTTTIPKLGYHLGNFQSSLAARKLTLINLDDYRVMAEVSLKKYGEWMRIPVYSSTNPEELKSHVALASESDHILIDTAGRNPKNFSKLLENRQMLSSIPVRFECLLTLSATTKTQDLETIVRQFEPYEARDVIVTKLDETNAVGNILSVLWENRKRIRYITTGQVVPTDFSIATKTKIMQYLQGFSDDVMRSYQKEGGNG